VILIRTHTYKPHHHVPATAMLELRHHALGLNLERNTLDRAGVRIERRQAGRDA
jgi:hypothetical protein